MRNYKDQTVLDPRQTMLPFGAEALGDTSLSQPIAQQQPVPQPIVAPRETSRKRSPSPVEVEPKESVINKSESSLSLFSSKTNKRAKVEKDSTANDQPVVRKYSDKGFTVLEGLPYRDLTIVLPTLNEVENIGPMLDELAEVYRGVSIVVVDDGSEDGTPDEVRIRTERYQERKGVNISLVERNDRLVKGITASVLDSLSVIKTEYMVLMDADFQHPITAVQQLYEELESGADVAIGCRDAGKGLIFRRGPTLWSGEEGSLSFSRTLASWAATKLARTTLTKSGIDVQDPLSGLFGVRTDLFRAVVARANPEFEVAGYKVLYDLLRLLPRLGSHGNATEIREILYRFCQRQGGESKLKAVHGICFLRAVIAEKFQQRK